MPAPIASIVITNFNYARFLRQSIDSALKQTRRDVEVIVVDDGSTDDSREIIESFTDRVTPIFKSNAGQASAFNAGFAASSGELICFLDADDALLSTAMARATDAMRDRSVSKVHWPLRVIDNEGAATGHLLPRHALPQGDLRDEILRDGPGMCAVPPTSGNAFARWFCEKVLPMPQEEFRICADAYLLALAPMHGKVAVIDEPQALYRGHGENNYWGKPFEQTIRQGIEAFERQCEILRKYAPDITSSVDPENWKQTSWWHRLQRCGDDIAAHVPATATFILVDHDQFGAEETFAGRRRIPMMEKDGAYWGPPATDRLAIEELERLKNLGAEYFVLAWPAFWWREQYPKFIDHLRARYTELLANERVLIFTLCERP